MTAALSALAPSTDTVNMGGGEEWVVEEETEEVKEEARDSERRHGENEIAEEEI